MEERMEERLNLIQKLAKIRAISDVVSKNKKGFNYKYADITEILANITAGMKKYGVSLIPSIVPGTSQVSQNVVVNTKFDKAGKAYEQTSTEMIVRCEMIFKWVNDDDLNDCIDVPWLVVGSQADPSQALGSALTYCTRYFLCNYFQIAQPESDVDAYRSKQKEAEASEDRAVAEGIIDQFDTILKAFIADHPDKKDDVVKFCGKYARNANYRAIKEPALAAKLLADFRKNYLGEE
jgi:hypothetical protein